MRLLRRLSLFVLFASIISCGGGEDGGFGSTPDDPEASENYVISLTISSPNVTPGNPATVTALVTDDGAPVANQLVTFSMSADLATFTPESGTALTGADGVANIIINAGEISGAGLITVAADGADSESIGFTTEAATAAVLRLGSGEPFVANTIDLSVEQLSAGGTSVISVRIVDENDNLYTQAAEVNFTSSCAAAVVPTAVINPVVNTSNGIAQTTYRAAGCVGDDPITVSALIGGQSLNAIGVINVIAADVSNIVRVSESAQLIGIKTAGNQGRPENSTVIFRVNDTDGNPVNGQEVSFELENNKGGITLNPVIATTDAEGLVQTVINSGTALTTVSVKATIVDSEPLKYTSSNLITISTAFPDQNSFTLETSDLNPEGWDIAADITLTATLGDIFDHVAAGTAVTFRAEGGLLGNNTEVCHTDEKGQCSVNWRSTNHEVHGNELGDSNNSTHQPETANTMGQIMGGRVSIVAIARGEESFKDINDNGVFDECELIIFTGGPGKANPCNPLGEQGDDVVWSGLDSNNRPYDLDEAYIDANEDGIYDTSVPGGEYDQILDDNNNGRYDGKNGLYDGSLCAQPIHAGCSEDGSVFIRSNLVIVSSGSNPVINVIEPTAPTVLPVGGSGSISVIVSDLHNQPMPSGTKITFETDEGSISSGANQEWGGDNHNGGQQWNATIKASDEAGKSAAVTMTVEVPSGLKTSFHVANFSW